MSRHGYILLTKEKWWSKRVEQSRAGMRTQSFVRKSAVVPIKTTARHARKETVDKLIRGGL